MDQDQPTVWDRLGVGAVATLLAAFILGFAGPVVANASQGVDLAGKRDDDVREVIAVEDDDDDDDLLRDKVSRKGDKTGKTTRGDRSDKTGKNTGNGKDTRTGKNTGKKDKTGKTTRGDRSDKTGKNTGNGKDTRTGKSKDTRTDKTDRSDDTN